MLVQLHNLLTVNEYYVLNQKAKRRILSVFIHLEMINVCNGGSGEIAYIKESWELEKSWCSS